MLHLLHFGGWGTDKESSTSTPVHESGSSHEIASLKDDYRIGHDIQQTRTADWAANTAKCIVPVPLIIPRVTEASVSCSNEPIRMPTSGYRGSERRHLRPTTSIDRLAVASATHSTRLRPAAVLGVDFTEPDAKVESISDSISKQTSSFNEIRNIVILPSMLDSDSPPALLGNARTNRRFRPATAVARIAVSKGSLAEASDPVDRDEAPEAQFT
ncbi:unnamed protein product [Protopolystoma xenopodis]|uniref:Uncharacterized protein n=1 Tax=Protopolystoma xenopodis TaxID=117903 RepID=A0A3S5FFT3_9PLAT|nr:unnamed protein product [Protopolystoma xenopodis]